MYVLSNVGSPLSSMKADHQREKRTADTAEESEEGELQEATVLVSCFQLP